jgi:hypothetical protein
MTGTPTTRDKPFKGAAARVWGVEAHRSVAALPVQAVNLSALRCPYLFVYALELPSSAKTITLPENANIRIMGISVAQQESAVVPTQPLFDTLNMSSKTDKFEAVKQ